MTLKIQKASELAGKKLTILVYGDPGVGKTTFAVSAIAPVIADAESGATYIGSHYPDVDVARIIDWGDMQEF